jgi:hypothetical protein
MSAPLISLYAALQDALLRHDAAPALPHIRANPRIPPQRQLAIYIEGYRTRLLLAIRSDYPELLELLGEAAFDRLAGDYVEAHPPHHFNLDRYPHGFAAFAQPHIQDGLARDMARMEAAIAHVFMAPDSNALTASAIMGLSPDDFGSMALTPRAASCLLSFSHPVEAYLQAKREGRNPERALGAPCFMFMLRHHNEVRRHVLAHTEYCLLEKIAAGHAVADALDSVAGEHPEMVPGIAAGLQAWFARWTSEGFFQTNGAET